MYPYASGAPMYGAVQGYQGTPKPYADRKTLDDQQRNPRKIFVGNLPSATTEKTLTVYFSQYGALEDCVVVIDKRTGQSRGFGFIVFQSEQSVDQVMNQPQHKIDGATADIRRAVPRDEARQEIPPDAIEQPEKLFVGGLAENVTEDDLKSVFGVFGNVKDVHIMLDKIDRRPRGFAFVVMEGVDAAQAAVGVHQIKGRMCEAKKAEPNRLEGRGRGGFDRPSPYGFPPGGRGGRGGRGGYMMHQQGHMPMQGYVPVDPAQGGYYQMAPVGYAPVAYAPVAAGYEQQNGGAYGVGRGGAGAPRGGRGGAQAPTHAVGGAQGGIGAGAMGAQSAYYIAQDQTGMAGQVAYAQQPQWGADAYGPMRRGAY